MPMRLPLLSPLSPSPDHHNQIPSVLGGARGDLVLKAPAMASKDASQVPAAETNYYFLTTPPPPSGTFMTLEDVLQALPIPPADPTPEPAAPKVLLVHRKKLHPSASASPSRRQPLIVKEQPGSPGARCAELAGGTTAECAAVVCCCPCGLVNLLVLATVRLPAGLCRRALREKRRKRGKKKSGLLRSRPLGFDDDEDFGMPRIVPLMPEAWPAKSPSMEVSEKEKEMWAQFYSAGFWRSPSQRE